MFSTSVMTVGLLTVGTVVSAAAIGVTPTFAIPSRSVLVGRQGFETAWTRSVAERQDIVTIITATRTVLEPAATTAPAHPHWPPPPPPPHSPSVDTSDIFLTRTAGTLTLIERQDIETIIGATRTQILPAITTSSTKKASTTAKPTTEKVNTSDVFITRTLSLLTLIDRQDTETIITATRTQILPVPTTTTKPTTTATPPKPTTQKVNTSDIFVTRTASALSLTIW